MITLKTNYSERYGTRTRLPAPKRWCAWPYTRRSNCSTLESFRYGSNVTPHKFLMTAHYNFFTAKLVERVGFDSNKTRKVPALRAGTALYRNTSPLFGAPRWIRTIDPPVKSRMLYQLS